ncbi:MAG TPA: hypothetical protein VFL36_00930 [Myxococcales bacterium]|nr:hypothetical protein [Myxococcales bacterium]
MWRRNKTLAVTGAAVGLVLFLAVGFLPAMMYGGYAGLMLADGIFGSPLPQHLFARGLVGFGMLLGVFATAAIFAVSGAAAASALGHMIAAASREPPAKVSEPQAKTE